MHLANFRNFDSYEARFQSPSQKPWELRLLPYKHTLSTLKRKNWESNWEQRQSALQAHILELQVRGHLFILWGPRERLLKRLFLSNVWKFSALTHIWVPLPYLQHGDVLDGRSGNSAQYPFLFTWIKRLRIVAGAKTGYVGLAPTNTRSHIDGSRGRFLILSRLHRQWPPK